MYSLESIAVHMISDNLRWRFVPAVTLEKSFADSDLFVLHEYAGAALLNDLTVLSCENSQPVGKDLKLYGYGTWHTFDITIVSYKQKVPLKFLVNKNCSPDFPSQYVGVYTNSLTIQFLSYTTSRSRRDKIRPREWKLCGKRGLGL